MAQSDSPYPVQFAVDYPDGARDRFTVFFRVLFIIPILIAIGAVSGQSGGIQIGIMKSTQIGRAHV